VTAAILAVTVLAAAATVTLLYRRIRREEQAAAEREWADWWADWHRRTFPEQPPYLEARIIATREEPDHLVFSVGIGDNAGKVFVSSDRTPREWVRVGKG
jgi:hypothetical protein